MHVRIGVNLGDVIEEDDGTLYGDGVNIAARMEALAEAGAVCISSAVYEAVEGKLALGFDFLGEQQVKNIAKPVRVYRVRAEPRPLRAGPGVWRQLIPRTGLPIIGAMALILLVSAGALTWQVMRSRRPAEDPVLALPKGPAIAVLPFVNVSGDLKQEYFADGIAEDIITALSKLRGLVVIARNSTFQYKGKPMDVRQVSRELGARYVLEGSVRKAGDRVRITAQLIDASTGDHLWAERYDRPLKDIFAVQDEITQKIVTELDVKLVEGKEALSWRRTTASVEAYEYFLQGREQNIRMTRESLTLGRELLEKAIRLDPKFAMAYAFLAANHLLVVIFGFSESPPHDLERGLELARRAIDLDDSQGYPHVMLGRIYMQKRQLDEGLHYGKKAVDLEPNGAEPNSIYAHILEAAGRPEEALAYISRAMRLGPMPMPWWLWLQGLCLKQLGRYEEAIAATKRAIALNPEWLAPHAFLVDIYVAAGREKDARAEAQEVLRLDPTFSVDTFLKGFDWYKDPNMLRNYAANLRKAGLK
jgi:TolB-like protein/Tfp pilus assembly protein PilF